MALILDSGVADVIGAGWAGGAGGKRQCRVQIAQAVASGCVPTGPGLSSISFWEKQKEGNAAIFKRCPTGPEVRKRNLVFLKPPRRDRMKGGKQDNTILLLV